MFKKVLSFCCFICIISHISYSQTDVLNTKISYSASNKPLTEVLRDIEKLTNFRFTFNSSIIPDTEIVTITIQQQSLDEALTLLLKNKYSYKLFGNQILITEFQHKNQTPTPEPKVQKPPTPKPKPKQVIDTIRVYDTVRTQVTDTITVQVFDTIVYTQTKYKKAYEKPVSFLNFALYTGSLLSIPITTGALHTDYKERLQKSDHLGIGSSKTLSVRYSKQDVSYGASIQYSKIVFSNTYSSTMYVDDGTTTYTDTLWYWKYTKLFTYYKFNSTGDSVAITVYDSLYTYRLEQNPKKVEVTDHVTSHVSLQYISIPLELGYTFTVFDDISIEPSIVWIPHILVVRKGLYPGVSTNSVNIKDLPIKQLTYSIGVSCNIGMQVYKEFGIAVKPLIFVQPKVYKNQNKFQQAIPTLGIEWGITYTFPYEIF
mgnify:CR=1 FL=1